MSYFVRIYLFELVVVEDHSFLDSTVVRVCAFRVVVPPRCDSRSLGGQDKNIQVQGLPRLFRYSGESRRTNSIDAVEEPVLTFWGPACVSVYTSVVVVVVVVTFSLLKDSRV